MNNVTIPSNVLDMLTRTKGATYNNGKLSYVSYCNDVKLPDVGWYRHTVDENIPCSKTTVELKSGKYVEVIGNYYANMNILDNCYRHLQASVGDSEDYPDLEIIVQKI